MRHAVYNTKEKRYGLDSNDNVKTYENKSSAQWAIDKYYANKPNDWVTIRYHFSKKTKTIKARLLTGHGEKSQYIIWRRPDYLLKPKNLKRHGWDKKTIQKQVDQYREYIPCSHPSKKGDVKGTIFKLSVWPHLKNNN